MGAQESMQEAPVVAVKHKIGDRVVCIGTSFGRFEKGQVGMIRRLHGAQALILLDGRDMPIMIDSSSFEHADGIQWELSASKPRQESRIKEHIKMRGGLPTSVARMQELEEGLQELFSKHDLKGNGVLEELELIKLNQKIAMLHYGKGSKEAEKGAITEKYGRLFREQLDARGSPVVYPVFREYTLKQLDAVDLDPRAQVMIVDQWIAEAESGREAFRFTSMESETDAPFMPHCRALPAETHSRFCRL